MTKILDFYASKAWAIQESSLQEMYGIYQAAIQRRIDGTDLDVEAVQAKTGKRLDNTRSVETRGSVAIIPVTGPIFRRANLFTEMSGATSIQVLAKDFEQALSNPDVKSILFEINSPGGEVDGTSEFAQHIFDARGKKPIVAYVSHLGASAAYWIASAADEIVSQETASLGSIGVVGTVSIDDNKRLKMFVSDQSPNKRPDPTSQKGAEQIQGHINDLAQVFIDTVARNRDWTAQEVIDKGGAGGMRVGQKAVDSGLADRLGTLEGLISELSSGMWQPRKKSDANAENLNSNPVLQDAGHSLAGEERMAEEAKDKIEAPKPDAVDDKALTAKIHDGIASFFAKFSGGSGEPKLDAPKQASVDTQAVQEAQRRAEAAESQAKVANDRVAQLEKDARATRFKSLAKDWPGEESKHVAMLETLAASQEGGETSQAFTDHVTNMNAIAEQARVGGLFRVVGKDNVEKQSAYEQLQAKAKELMASDSKLSKEAAMSKASEQNKDLYKAYIAEQREAA